MGVFGDSKDQPYLYILIRHLPTNTIHEVNLGCPGFDFTPGCEAKILNRMKEIEDQDVRVFRDSPEINR